MSHLTVAILRGAFKQGHEVLEATMSDVSDEMFYWLPPGTANPIAANYAHIVTSEDFLLNALIRQGVPLMASSWADKTGLNELPVGTGTHEWAQRVRIDRAAMQAYTQAVYATTDSYLATLSEADFNKVVNLMSFGDHTVGDAITKFVLFNLNWHTGEIACLKGLQGKKGYPF